MVRFLNLPAWVIASPGLAAFLIAAIVSLWVPSYPNIHDDFGNLLIADTLLHGRFSNPTPPSHALLQSFHVVMTPTYAAKFPIGAGALMAVGQLVFGACHAGNGLAAAMACSGITWMLLARVSTLWAWALGMMAALHPTWQTGWSQEFTHGWLGVAATALVLGAVLRLQSKLNRSDWQRTGWWLDAVVMGFGLVLGIFSRPFEVALLSMLLSCVLLPPIFRRQTFKDMGFWRALAPAAMMVVGGLTLQAFINHSVTGKWTKLPYRLHEEQYGVAPVFLWQEPHEPTIGHDFEEQVAFHRGWSMEAYESARSWEGYVKLLGIRTRDMLRHWGWMLACAPWSILVFPRERRRYAWLLFIALAALLMINTVPWVSPSYVAPLIPIAFLMTTLALRAGVRALASLHRDSDPQPFAQTHRTLRTIAVLGLLFSQCIAIVAATRSMTYAKSGESPPWFVLRQDVEQELLESPGNHLVIVKYRPGHNIHHEWVFNRAVPQEARIVWARWSDTQTQKLIADYPNRNVWLLDVASDDTSIRVPFTTAP